jgi:hypothetical protein
MRIARFFVALCAFATSTIALPRTTHACSCAPNVSLVSPFDGAQAVPLDIAPLLRGHFDESSLQWKAADGTDVPFAARTGSTPGACFGAITELIPSQPLAAATSYVLRVEPRNGASEPAREFRFTTGAANVPQAVLPDPTLTITLVRGRAVYDSCVELVHGCFAVGPHDTELTFLGAGDQLLSWMLVQAEAVIERGAHPDTVCVEARTRDRAGRRSAAVRRCGAELGLRADRISDYDNYRLRCRDGRIVEAPASDVPDASVAALPTVRTDASAAHDSSSARLPHAAAVAPAPRSDVAASGAADEPARSAEDDDASQSASGCVAGASSQPSGGWLLLLLSASWLRVRRRTTRP